MSMCAGPNPGAGSPSLPKLRVAIPAILFLLLITFVSLHSELRRGFYADDFIYFDSYIHARTTGIEPHLIHLGGYLRPLAYDVVLPFFFQLFGLTPQPYHVVNLLLVFATVVAIYLLAFHFM